MRTRRTPEQAERHRAYMREYDKKHREENLKRWRSADKKRSRKEYMREHRLLLVGKSEELKLIDRMQWHVRKEATKHPEECPHFGQAYRRCYGCKRAEGCIAKNTPERE